MVHYNYSRRRRPLNLQDKFSGHISPFWSGVLRTANAFKIGLRLCYGNGATVRFWKDCWIGRSPLLMRTLVFLRWPQMQTPGLVLKFITMIGPLLFTILSLLQGYKFCRSSWNPPVPHISECPRSGDLEGGLLYQFHCSFSVSIIAPHSTTG